MKGKRWLCVRVGKVELGDQWVRCFGGMFPLYINRLLMARQLSNEQGFHPALCVVDTNFNVNFSVT